MRDCLNNTYFSIGSLTLLLCLTACGTERPLVRTLGGEDVGEVHVTDEDHAVIYDAYRNVKAKVRGGLIRDKDGTKLGEARIGAEEILLVGPKGTAVGSLSPDMTCLARDGTVKGRVTVKTDPEAAGAGCLVLLLKPSTL